MPDSSAPCILVVDDDPALIRLLRLSLVAEGFDVVTATDGLNALDALDSHAVDAIVLDLQMPRMDGRTFHREMRKRGQTVPVLILSAYGVESARDELHAEAVMRKPFDPDILIAEVRRLVNRNPTGN